jgi:hypothetical protein
MKACGNCGHLVYGFVMVCPECGEVFPKKEKPVIDLQDMDIVEVEADLQDLYHAKQIRRIIRECYSAFELPFIKIGQYLSRHKIKNISQIVTDHTLQGAIFKHRTLQNLLDLTWYVDYHTIRLQAKKFYKDELQHLQGLKEKHRDREVLDWIDVLSHACVTEFTKKFLFSKAVIKYVGEGKWQDVLGVLDFDSRENMEAAYRQRWQESNAEVAKHLQYQDGEIDPDHIAQFLNSGNSPELKDLHSRIAVLEWAYKYVHLRF